MKADLDHTGAASQKTPAWLVVVLGLVLIAGLGLVTYFIMDKPPAPAAIETELTPAQEQALFGDIKPDRVHPRNLD